MITIRPGSHVHTLILMLSFVGEFPVCSLHLLGSFRSYRDLIRKLTQELRNTQKMDNGLFATYTNIFFISMDDFGVRLLRILTLPTWYERLQQGLFRREVRSFGKGSFTYDAYQNGIFSLSFLDGDLWRLFRFREAILSREGNFCVYCFHEQVDFLRRYLGDRIRLATVSIESVERVFKIEEKCLL